jgi:hypothetical protein
MSIVLRIVAALVMLVGVVALIVMTTLLVVSDGIRGIALIDNSFAAISLAGIAATFGGMLWALTRLAYRQPAAPAPQPAMLADSRPPQVRLYGTGSVLRILALLQIGFGIVAFALFYYALVSGRGKSSSLDHWIWTFLIAAASWGYAGLGGILLVLTRIAYPPTPRPQEPDREPSPRGPANP